MAKAVVLPKSLAAVADLMYETREKRYQIQKDVEALQSIEAMCSERLISELPKSKAEGITGKVATAQIVTKEVPTVKDWAKLHAYILRNKALDLLERRISSKAVEMRWNNRKKIPGVDPFTVVKVSLTAKPKK